jgi:putative Mg2+ transporter-C (MgtC) family protein
VTAWQEVVDAIAADFADLDNAGTMATVCFRLLLAALLGGMLGYERESKGKSAGLRTHMLVALGATVFILVPTLSGDHEIEVSRIVQGLVAGIGFLGAGAIVKGRPGEEVQGLTTAAGIWMTAAIGVAVGLGRASTAIISTVMALAVLTVVHHTAHWLGNGRQQNARPEPPDTTNKPKS